MTSEKITVYGPRAQGGRNLGLTLNGVQVLLSPQDEARQADAERIAVSVLENETAREALLARIQAMEAEVADLRGHLEQARSKVRAAEERATAATTGRRRFFGAVLLRPAQPGAWDGPVWLLDPEKKERGSGLRFASLAEVRQMHPELWVIAVTADGVLLDAWGEPDAE